MHQQLSCKTTIIVSCRLYSHNYSPESVEHVQAIVRLANRCGLPLWMVSRGKNLGYCHQLTLESPVRLQRFSYGGPAPRQSGSIIVSLHRMNRIIEANQELAYVVVEPGVTFFDVDNYFKKNKLDLWISAPALGWGSVVGNVGNLPFIAQSHLLYVSIYSCYHPNFRAAA